MHNENDFFAISRAFGLNPLDKRDESQQLHPSKPSADYLWRRVASKCGLIEQSFVQVYYMLATLKGWEKWGFNKPEDTDDMAAWMKIRAKALPLLLDRFGFLEEEYEDGAGI